MKNEPRSLNWHLNQPYPYTVVPDPEGGYVIFFPDLPGCMMQVETAEEIAPMADEIRALWIETEFERGHEIPLPSGSTDYSGKFLVRVPRSLHRTLAESAERDGVSMNAYVTMLLARGVGQECAIAASSPSAEREQPPRTRRAGTDNAAA
jgi:predicted RNase H-like HicB family nuclease